MGKYFHVARSYWRRPRFWIFGGWFALVVQGVQGGAMRSSPTSILGFGAVSAVFAGLVVTFIALHVRRQFATPQARLTPHFTGPHLAVPAALTLLAWVAVPWFEAWRIGVPPVVMISLHTIVAVLMAVVVFWPKLSVLLAIAPICLIWPMEHYARTAGMQAVINNFTAGKSWFIYAGLLTLAAISYPLAAWRLLRLSDVSVATSDDFTIEPPGSQASANRLTEMLHSLRDTKIERKVAVVTPQSRSISQRRIPSAPAIPQLAGFAAIVLALVALAWVATGEPLSGWLVMAAGTGLMLFAPFGYWRFRLIVLNMELMFPATRTQAVRAIQLAMATDIAIWAAAASLTMVLTYLMLWGQEGFVAPWASIVHLTLFWSAAFLLLGIGLASMRLRYWIPVFAGALVASIMAVGWVTTMLIWVLHPLPPGATNRGEAELLPLVTFPIGFTLIGLILCLYSYRRWRETDVA